MRPLSKRMRVFGQLYWDEMALQRSSGPGLHLCGSLERCGLPTHSGVVSTLGARVMLGVC